MIEKTSNPLNLGLKQIDVLITELQDTFNKCGGDLGPFSLDESGVSIEIELKSGTHSYNLAQLKLLKTELLDPVAQKLEGGVMNAKILDPCCGSRMMHFDPQNKNVIYGDIRKESHILCDGRSLEVAPDIEMDFRNMPFKDEQFSLVVFDPPHLIKAGKQSWLALKYGKLNDDWREDIRKGFEECFRVLANDGVLIFKWNETQIKVSEILELTNQKPVFGHISGKRANTHWITFMKMDSLKEVL